MTANFTNLPGKILFRYLPPNAPAFTIFIRAFFEECQLFAPLTDEGVQPEQLRLELEDLSLFAFH